MLNATVDALEQIERLEAGDDDRDAKTVGEGLVFLVAHDRADVARPRGSLARGYPGDARMAVIAGGTSTCETSTQKFLSPRRLACQTAMALAGAVVSKPIAKKTTLRSGFCCGDLQASSGE